MPSAPEKLLLAAPRGYCAGVDRAVQTVERALDLYGAPVYVRKEIVHNKHVVEQLRERGAVFVDQETEVPEGETVVFSAHGVAPSVHRNAEARALRTIDATCPLVTKVHVEAKKFAAEGYTIVLVGHAGHEEVEGTMGEAPDHIVLIETEADVDALEVEDPDRVAYISQTTLSVDETNAIIARLRERFPNITGPRTDDICYATTNRQAAVRQMARECDLVLVIGSRNSSNSNRLVEVARDHGADSYLIDNESRGARGVARGQARGGHHLRRQRPRGAGAAAGRLLPRARHRGRLRVRGRPGGRALHAPARDPARAGRSRRSKARLAASAVAGSGVNWKPVQPQAGVLGHHRAVGLVEARLLEARPPTAPPTRRRRGTERWPPAGVGGLDVVLAVEPVAHQLEPLAVGRQRDVGGLRLEHHVGRVLRPQRLERLGERRSGSISSSVSWIARSVPS